MEVHGPRAGVCDATFEIKRIANLANAISFNNGQSQIAILDWAALQLTGL
jgi:hypothetical protein